MHEQLGYQLDPASQFELPEEFTLTAQDDHGSQTNESIGTPSEDLDDLYGLTPPRTAASSAVSTRPE